MTHFVGIKELRQNMDKYSKQVQRGDEVIVMKHNKPQFRMCRAADPFGDEGVWNRVIDFTKLHKGGVPIDEVLKALRHIRTTEDKAKRG